MPGHEDDDETHVKFVVRNSYRDRKPIGYVTIEQPVDEKTFQSLEYVDSRHEYVVQRKSSRSVGCQVDTKYEILLSTPNSPSTPTPPPLPSPPPQPLLQEKNDVGCQINTTYVILLSRHIPPTPLPPTPSPPPSPPISTNEVTFFSY